MNIDTEALQKHIPHYLTAEDQAVLVRELKAIAGDGTATYVLSPYYDDFKTTMLQGDGWRGFELFDFDSGERRSIRGMVLSNSCDVDPNNPREVPARIIFAPLVKLQAYKTLLDESGISAQAVGDKISAIKSQATTNLFYLPAGGNLEEDYLVRLDEAQSMPLSAHSKSGNREKLFTLSNAGFYMLVFKLSLHFCRLQERVNRSSAPAGA